jgi:protein-S-isoprenylcysteine O-methyltransferase Ste14
MSIYVEIVGLCWLAFLLVWFVFAMRSKDSGRGGNSPRSIGVRVLIAVFFVLGVRFANRIPAFLLWRLNEDFALAGAALCIAGVAFAIWARATIGRNWGMPMTLHDAPELVTSGPYRYVRHPIYAAMSAMVIGTALVFPPAVIWTIGTMTYMLFSARREEQDMERRFPDTYPEYKRRSKMFMPFLF